MKSLACLVACVCSVVAASGASAEARMDTTRTVGNPAPGPGTLELDDVLRRVLERNPSLSAARASWSAARARAQQAGALADPMVDVSVAPQSYGSANVSSAYRVGIEQSFAIFGQRGLRRRAAEAEAVASGWDLRSAQLDLVREARLAFIDYWRVDRAIALNQELLRLLPEIRRVTLAKYAAGLVGQQDPLQVDVEVAMLDHQVVILERERHVTAATLNVLMHEPPESALPPPPADLPLPDTTLGHEAPEASMSHATGERSEQRAADARVDAARAQVSLAGRQRLPETGFGLAYDRFWSEPELRASVGVTMNLPVFLGRLSAAQREARAQLDASEAQSQATRDSIALQVAVATARLHEQAHDVDIALNRMVPLSERTLRAVRAGYETDRSDFLTLLNALRDFLRVRLEADESVAMLHAARADLERALGELPPGVAPGVQP